MLVQSVGCEDADTSKIADKSASLFVLNLLSSEVLLVKAPRRSRYSYPLRGHLPRKGLGRGCCCTLFQLSCHMDALQAFHAV